MFLHHLVPWPPIDIHVKFYGDRPRGTPTSGELNTRGVAEYSKTSLTRTSGDRPKTSVLAKVRVIRKLHKKSQSCSTFYYAHCTRLESLSQLLALLPYRVYRLFRQTASRRNCCLFLPASVLLIITILWSKSNSLCAVVTHFDAYDTTDAPAACNISIPSPAVVFTARSSLNRRRRIRSLIRRTCSELSGPTLQVQQPVCWYNGGHVASTLYVM